MCVCFCLDVYICVCVSACVCACMRVCSRVYVCVCLSIRVCVSICVCGCVGKKLVADINLDDPAPREKLDVRRDPSCFPILLYLLLTLAAGSAGLCTLLLF